MNQNEYHFIFSERSSAARVPLVQRMAYDGNSKLIYYGLARKGTAASDEAWVIERYTYDGDNLVLTEMSTPNVKWEDRETLSYS